MPNPTKSKWIKIGLGVLGGLVILLIAAIKLSPNSWLGQSWQQLSQRSGADNRFAQLFPADDTTPTQTLTVNGHQYGLTISSDQSKLLPLPGTSASFIIQLTDRGRAVKTMPTDLLPKARAGESAELQLKLSGVANIYPTNTANFMPARQEQSPYPMTHIYSPQVTDRYRYAYKSTELTATLSFNQPKIEVGYVYGGGKIADHLTIEAAALFYQGAISQTARLAFADESTIATSSSVPQPQYRKGDFYYQVEFSPARVNSKKETYVTLSIKSINTQTGRINTTPYQRVRLEVWPMRAFYALKEARFEEAGKFLVAKRLEIAPSASGSIVPGTSYDRETGERITGWLSMNTANPKIMNSIIWYLVKGDNSLVVDETVTAPKKTLTWLDQQILEYQKNYLSGVYSEKQMADYLASMELLPQHVNYAEMDLVDGVGEIYFRYSGNIGAIPYATFVVSPINFASLSIGRTTYCDDGSEYWAGMYLPAGNNRSDQSFCMIRPPQTAGSKALYQTWMSEADFQEFQSQILTSAYLPIDR